MTLTAYGYLSGVANVFSGIDGLESFTLEIPGEFFNDPTFDGIPDRDGDGLPEILLGHGHSDTGNPEAGSIYVFSSRGTGLLMTITGTDAFPRLGTSVKSIDDVNNDGVADILAGAPGVPTQTSTNTPRAYVFSGANGSVIHLMDGRSLDDAYGLAVDSLADMDSDGIRDLLISSNMDSFVGPFFGYVLIRSGATGGILKSIESPT